MVIEMASKLSSVPDNKFDILFVKRTDKDEVRFSGYKRDYLAQNLTELEEGMVICAVCKGIMREASFVKGETTCRVCSRYPGEENGIKIVENSVNKLDVKCPLLRDCEWKGKLSEAELHLIDCAHCLIECFDCQQVILRGETSSHEENSCPMRGNNSGNIKTVMMECPFSELGCAEKLMTQNDLKVHEETNLVEHTRLSLAQVKEQKIEIKFLKKELENVKWKMRSMKCLDGVEWEIQNIDQLDSEAKLEGPIFYIHNYKFQCYYKYCPKDNYLTFFLKRKKGDFEKNLEKLSITQCHLSLVNEEDHRNSYYKQVAMSYQPSFTVQFLEFSTLKYREYKFQLTANNSLMIRMYFDVNSQNTNMSNSLIIPTSADLNN